MASISNLRIYYNKYTKKIVLIAFTALCLNPIFAQKTTWAKDFSDAIIYRYSNINDLTGKGWEYSNSIVLIGIEKLYYETGDAKYLNYIKKYIDKYVDANGNISFNPAANNLDHLHPGWLCITLYEELKLDKYKKAAENIRAEFDNQPTNSQGGFWHKQVYENQMWVDGIYMAEPFLIRYGSVFNDLEYAADEATHQVILLADHAYDSTKNLMLHGWDESDSASWADTVTGTSPEVWSRGMGWYCMALVDILDYLPQTHKNYARLIEILNGLAIGIKDYQDTDSGLWYQVVDKGNLESNWLETSGSSMFVYALKKAIDNNYIDSVTYMPVVQKGWNGLQTKITLDNSNRPIINDFVWGMGIKDSYDSYISQTKVSTPDSRYSHGYCGILLAASVMEFPLPEYYSLTVTKSSGGYVAKNPSNIEYISGSEVILTSSAYAGWEFVGWTGSIESVENPIILSMDSSISIKANFSEILSGTVNTSVNSINIYPSLVETELNIDIPEGKVLKTWCIVNSLGEEVIIADQTAKYTSQKINVSNLKNGIYYLVVQTINEKYSIKFIKH